LLEKPATPMHVGILLRFMAPDGSGGDYVRHVLTSLRTSPTVATPWDLILPMQKLKGLIPVWLHDSYVDMDYHVQLHTLMDGDEEALNETVAELHGQPLDRSRPLWECHVIEGLPAREFALYVKVHHALLDGVGGLRLMQQMLSRSSDSREPAAPWAAFPGVRAGTTRAAPPQKPAQGGPRILASLSRAAREMARAARNPLDALVTPYSGPVCPLNRPITQRRTFVAQEIGLGRIKSVARRSGGSTNDVVLAICGGALKRLLQDQESLPVRPLVAAMPVSTRERHDHGTGTAISFCLANLGTDVGDPVERLLAIQASTQRAKEYFGRLPRRALMPFTAIMMLPFLLEQLAKMAGRFRPMFNVVISNVPGPRAPLYLEGARLQSASPLSVLFHGQALNITCVRYLDTVSFGFTGCPDALTGLQRLPDYMHEALSELERASFPRAAMGVAEPMLEAVPV
jgi:WS/DGAT/MGAT family acyltransferase